MNDCVMGGSEGKKGKGALWMFLFMLSAVCLIWLPSMGIQDFEDAMSNEVEFSRQSMQKVFYDIPWKDQSPFYFVVLKLWRVLAEDSIPGIRALNVVMIIFCIALMGELSTLFFKSKLPGYGAGILYSLSPISIWLLREGRMYPMMIALGLFTLCKVERYLQTQQKGELLVAGIAASLNIYTHFFGGWLTAITMAYFFTCILFPGEGHLHGKTNVRARLPMVYAFIQVNVLILLLIIPQAMRILNVTYHEPMVRSSLSTAKTMSIFFKDILNFNILRPTAAGFMNWNWSLPSAYYAIFFIGAILGYFKAPGKMKILALIWVVSSLLILAELSLKYDFRTRYFSFIGPMLFLLTANGWLRQR